jgi:hypothetical protein
MSSSDSSGGSRCKSFDHKSSGHIINLLKDCLPEEAQIGNSSPKLSPSNCQHLPRNIYVLSLSLSENTRDLASGISKFFADVKKVTELPPNSGLVHKDLNSKMEAVRNINFCA